MHKNLSKDDIIKALKTNKIYLKNEFGVLNIGLFGSYAVGTQRPDSDIDFLVELEKPRFDLLAGLQIHLEKMFGKRIEIVRKANKINTRLFDRIGEQVIYA